MSAQERAAREVCNTAAQAIQLHTRFSCKHAGHFNELVRRVHHPAHRGLIAAFIISATMPFSAARSHKRANTEAAAAALTANDYGPNKCRSKITSITSSRDVIIVELTNAPAHEYSSSRILQLSNAPALEMFEPRVC